MCSLSDVLLSFYVWVRLLHCVLFVLCVESSYLIAFWNNKLTYLLLSAERVNVYSVSLPLVVEQHCQLRRGMPYTNTLTWPRRSRHHRQQVPWTGRGTGRSSVPAKFADADRGVAMLWWAQQSVQRRGPKFTVIS